MIKLGKIQELQLKRFTSVGAYLNEPDGGDDGDVLLPSQYLKDEMHIDQVLEVFIYCDSEDRPVATTQRPNLLCGEIGRLSVVSVSKIGAFLDWGLPKDLFLPADEQKTTLKKGDDVVVYLYLDSSDRLSASMRIEQFLTDDSPYQIGDWVEGTVYKLHSAIGAFIAVDNRYRALIPSHELVGDLSEGQTVHARVTYRKADGKLDLALRDKVAQQIHEDVAQLLSELERAKGFLAYNDKSDPAAIRAQFRMSKKAFKRAIGVLLKEDKIEFANNGIALKE